MPNFALGALGGGGVAPPPGPTNPGLGLGMGPSGGWEFGAGASASGAGTAGTAADAAKFGQQALQAGDFGKAADLMCQPAVVIPACPCGFITPGKCPKGPQTCCPSPAGPQGNKFQCPPSPDICSDVTQGSLTFGTCVLPLVCKGVSTSFGGFSLNLGGINLGGIAAMLAQMALQQALQSGNQQNTGSTGVSGSGGVAGGCTQYYQTTNPADTNPCAVYTPPSSEQLGTGGQSISEILGSSTGTTLGDILDSTTGGSSQTLEDLLGGGQSVGDLLSGLVDDDIIKELEDPKSTIVITGIRVVSEGTEISLKVNGKDVVITTSQENALNIIASLPETTLVVGQEVGPGAPTTGTVVTTQPGGLQNAVQNFVQAFRDPVSIFAPGLRGDVTVSPSGATIIVGSRGTTTEIAGFFGSNTFGNSDGVIGRLCSSRPWAGGFLAAVIPASFFDGLCEWRGYKVGPQVAVPNPAPYTSSRSGDSAGSNATSTVQSIPPKVDIWAVPPSVSLGSRTTVFWQSQGVANCLVSSPDGSFTHTSVQGAASTVAITAATTYTISCTTQDGTPVTDFVTVKIAI